MKLYKKAIIEINDGLFFIMKKINLILLLSCILSFYNYDLDDWFFVLEPNTIKSITQDSFSVYFLADNGIYTYDYMDDKIFYNSELSNGLSNEENYYIYYHPSIDYFFIISKNYILYKSRVSSLWNKKSFSSFGVNSLFSINRIGFSDDYIIIDSNNQYKKINLFTMFPTDEELNQKDNIYWLNENLNNFELSNFYTLDNSLVGSDYIKDIYNIKHFKTTTMYDSNQNLWVGMNTGAIYKVDDFSYELKRVNIGPRLNYVSDIYNDDLGNWYFFDNYFRRTGNYSDFNYNGYFLSIWNENEDSWIHISKNEDILVNDIIINDIERLGEFILFATIDGLVVYNLKTDNWFSYTLFLKKYNKSLWKMKLYNDKIYFATSSGIVVCDYSIINNELNIYFNQSIFERNEIYDMHFNNNHIYFSSDKGLYEYNFDGDLKLIDLSIYYDIKNFGSYTLASNNNLWYIDHSGKYLLSSNVNQFDSYDGNKICATDFNEIKIIDFSSKSEWNLNLNQFNINESIYSISCDDEWLWFPNSKGVSFFRWENYEN